MNTWSKPKLKLRSGDCKEITNARWRTWLELHQAQRTSGPYPSNVWCCHHQLYGFVDEDEGFVAVSWSMRHNRTWFVWSKEEQCCECSFVSICSQHFDSPGGRTNHIKRNLEPIKSWHLGADYLRHVRLHTLMTEFYRLRMDDNDMVDDFAVNISGLPSKAASLGENIEESKMVKQFLKGLLRQNYIQIIESL